MAYLRLKDYSVQTQAELTQVINNDDSIRLLAEAEALEEVKSYLLQKYNVSEEFADTTIYNPLLSYNAGDLVEINLPYLGYPAYNSASTYIAGDKVTYASVSYFCKTAITVPETFNLSKWTRIGAHQDLWYVSLPFPEFSAKAYYKTGDQVYWKGFTYTCLKDTITLSHEALLQYDSIESISNAVGPFPDDPTATANWGSKTEYSVSAGITPGNPQWTFGDNRNAKIVQVMVDVVIYTLWSRCAPRNMPPMRADRYRAAINWLEMIATGQVSSTLPLIQSNLRTNRIRFGGDIKNNNSY